MQGHKPIVAVHGQGKCLRTNWINFAECVQGKDPWKCAKKVGGQLGVQTLWDAPGCLFIPGEWTPKELGSIVFS